MTTQNICNICGANYEYKDGKWRCPACGAYKPEEISNEEETLLYNAAQKLRLNAFDDAEVLYRDVVSQYPKNSRGYWGLVLAKYGIKYEKDYDGKLIPSCYAASYESILDDENYKKALQYADKDNRAYYEAQAKRIEDVRRRWVEIAEREEPHDIFISYKDSDKENGIERTQDSYEAYELYEKLKEKGYRVFYSRESLAGKEGEKYEPYIFNALNTAQVMIVYGTKPEYIESTWVKNEWMRYYKRIKRGEKQENSLILAYKGFHPSELPKPLCDIQGIDLGRITMGFAELETRVANILSAARMRQKIARVSVKGRERRAAEHIRRLNTVKVGKVVSEEPKTERARVATRTIGGKSIKLSVNAEKSLSVAENYLLRGQFTEAEDRFDEILQSSPRNGRALTGKLLAQANARDLSDLEKTGFRIFSDVSLIENVLSNAEKSSAESVLRALCAEATRCFDRGDIAQAKLIVSVVKEYAGSAVDKLRDELYARGLNLFATDEESAKYFLDIHLSFEENEEEYIKKLHAIVNSGIERSAFSFAEYYADKLKEEDANSYETQLALLEIEYKTKNEADVLRHIDNEKSYQKIEDILSELDTKSAAKWLQACFAEIAELLQKGVYAGALRWIEICAKYQFPGRKSLLESLLSLCINSASMRSAECFDAILTYVADGDVSIYADKAKAFADTALKSKEFDAAKLYYGKILSVKPDSVSAAQGKFFADTRCANEKDLSSALVNLTDWSCFEEVLVVQTDDADDLKWIEKLASACIEHIRKAGTSANAVIFTVFEKLLSYIPNSSDDALLRLLRQVADLCLQEGLFVQSQKYYEMYISENAENSAIYWGLLQAKLKCRNDDELVRQSQPISAFDEFENAQVCAADDKEVLNHYIDVRDRQSRHIKAAKKRKRFIKIGSIVLAVVILIAAALVGWVTYYNSQSGLIYGEDNGGIVVSAGKFYSADSRLVIPDEIEGRAVVAIAANAFSDHSEIEDLVLPASIEVIGANAFADCVNLKTVTFVADTSVRAIVPQTALREIGDGAFSGCTNLEIFDLPYGVERIGARAFAGTDLSEATIPNTVNYIGIAAFDGCSRLQTIIVGDREEIPTEWAENWKDGCNAAVEFRLRVIFDYNGATGGNTVNEQYVLFGGEFNFPVPERKGYAFDGWFRGDTRLTDGRGNSMAEWQFEEGGEVTAQWAPNVNKVIFNANGGSGDMPEQEIATDETAALSGNTFTRRGYTFAGWAESATGSVVYEDGAEYTMGAESSYELFAVWVANRNEIVFDGNGATGGGMESQFMATDSSAALSENAFIRTGYTFVGWATSADGEVIYADGANYTMGAEPQYTLYAVWRAVDYTIRYNHNNGVAADNPSAYTIESEDIILKAPTRAGYRFTGWTGTGLSAPTLTVTIPMGSTGNREYTATWEANTNRVLFHANGGKGEMSAQSIKTDETAPLSSNLFTRTGYTFIGWAEEQSGEAEYSDGANYTMGAESEYTLYAVWKTIEYSISYILNGGSVSGNPGSYTIESDTFRLENPTRAGYTFAGWTGTGLEEPALAVTVLQGSTGNREYAATWKIIGHIVSNWSIGVEPTKKEEGLLIGECMDCQETIEIVLPKLNDASVADGTYTKTTKVDGGCANKSVYTYTYTIDEGEVFEIASFVNPEKKTTVTSATAFEDAFDVEIEGGFHYTVDIDGAEVAIDDTQPFDIEAYPEFKPYGNMDKEFAEADCETLIEEGAYFMCKHCGEVIAINVFGYHDYDEEKVVYHEATCTRPAYTSVYCNTEGEEIRLSEGTQVDPDNHVWGEPIVEPSEDGKNATVTFVCELCDEEKVIENAELVSKDVSYEDEFACMGDTITTYVYKDTATGELYTVEIRTDKVAHYITVDGERIEITDEKIENHVFTDEDGAFLDKVGNIDPTCSEEATRCRYFTCECCDTVYTVLYKQAHQKSEEVTPATCTEDAVWHCDRCGENWTEEGTALGHDYVLVKFEYDVEKNTFTLSIYCSRCEEIGTEGEPTKLEGKYTDLKITTVQEQSCSKDGIIDIEYTDPSTEEEYSFEGVNLGKAFHSYDGIVMDDSQTYNLTEYPFLKLTGNSPESCQGTGDAYFICEHCGELILLKVTGPHTKGDLIEEATCAHPAKYECTECGEQFYDGKPLKCIIRAIYK